MCGIKRGRFSRKFSSIFRKKRPEKDGNKEITINLLYGLSCFDLINNIYSKSSDAHSQSISRISRLAAKNFTNELSEKINCEFAFCFLFVAKMNLYSSCVDLPLIQQINRKNILSEYIAF